MKVVNNLLSLLKIALIVDIWIFLQIKSQSRIMSSSVPMPFDDDKMPFYALGVNLAKQVGGQTGFR